MDIIGFVPDVSKEVIAAVVVALLGGVALWLCSYRFMKARRAQRLETIETEHQKCEAERERLRKLDNPMAREMRAQIERARKSPELRAESEFDPRLPFENPK